MSFEEIEVAINEISDKDWSWWPFLWLRPEKHADLSWPRLILVAVLYGIPASGLLSLTLALARPEARAAAPFLVVGFPLLFLFFGSVLVAPMWNRRADRLRRRRS